MQLSEPSKHYQRWTEAEAAEAWRLHREDMSYQQIAIKLGRTEDSVRSKLSEVRSLRKLQERIHQPMIVTEHFNDSRPGAVHLVDDLPTVGYSGRTVITALMCGVFSGMILAVGWLQWL